MPDNTDNPIIQSQRLEIYKQKALELVEQNKAYVCTCTAEKLKPQGRNDKRGQAPMYDKSCRNKG